MCVCVRVLDGEGRWVFASTAVEVVWMAGHLTSYSDYLTGFCEPLLPPYRCHQFVECLAQSLVYIKSNSSSIVLSLCCSGSLVLGSFSLCNVFLVLL